MAEQIKRAHFSFGSTKIIKTFLADSTGGSFEIDNLNTPIDGTIITVPPGALKNKTSIAIGYNDGILKLLSGKSSGVIIILKSEHKISFDKPLMITVRFDPSINRGHIIGYEIDEKGFLHSVDTGAINKTLGTVSFYTFKPIILTWVYIAE